MTTTTESDERPPTEPRDPARESSASPEIVAILDSIDVPILVVGRNCTLIRINRAAMDALGLAATDIGRRLGMIGALSNVDDIEEICAQVIADDAPTRRDIRSGDRRFLLRVSPYAIGAAQTAGAVLTFTNVTAFRASIEQAICEREYTKAILNTIASPLVVLDARLRVQSGNRAFYSMFQLSREKAHGVAFQSFGDDDWKASRLWMALGAVVSGSGDFRPLQIERDFPAIGRRTLLLDARRVAREGDVTILLAAEDITDRKRTEEALQTADRRKDEFLALLAHELRNPLAPIRTGLELIRMAGDTPEAVRRVRSIMERQVTQMVRLIDDLLDVSRIASGKIVLKRAPTSLTDLVQAAVDSQRAAIERSEIELTVDVPLEAAVVDVDPTRFGQILSNVLHNAWKFTPRHGKIRCVVTTLPSTDIRRVAITISDTGIGIAKDTLPRVFEMFTQGELATERSHGGLGIGLALAQRLAQMHDGEIVAHSGGPGQGSTFTITLPVCGALLAPASFGQHEVLRVACRALIIDDNRDAAVTLAMLVNELGGSTRMALDGASGLEAMREYQPDIVFLDIGMPGMDGYEACRRIRQGPSQESLVLVAVTGWGQPQDQQRALEAGFDAHLTKPVSLEALAPILAAIRPTQCT